jgi:hypothetical protein
MSKETDKIDYSINRYNDMLLDVKEDISQYLYDKIGSDWFPLLNLSLDQSIYDRPVSGITVRANELVCQSSKGYEVSFDYLSMDDTIKIYNFYKSQII